MIRGQDLCAIFHDFHKGPSARLTASVPSFFDVERVTVYIDGYNLYYGLRDKGLRKYLWLDIPALAARLMKPGQTLTNTKYFTARVRKPADTVKRQSVFLDALRARGGLEIVEGRYQITRRDCRHCGKPWDKAEEKRTDVNIATAMLTDAATGACDTAVLISADSDLVAPVTAVQQAFGKRAVVFFPPGRKSEELRRAATVALPIFEKIVAQCLLPETVETAAGVELRRPPTWT